MRLVPLHKTFATTITKGGKIPLKKTQNLQIIAKNFTRSQMPPDSGNLDSLLPASSRFMLQNQKNKRKKNHVNNSLEGLPPLRDLRLFPTAIKHQRKSRIKHVYISPSCSFFECFSTTISLLKNRSNQYIYCLCACLLNTWKEKVAKNQQKKNTRASKRWTRKRAEPEEVTLSFPTLFFLLNRK